MAKRPMARPISNLYFLSVNNNGQKKEVDKKEEGHFIKVLVK